MYFLGIGVLLLLMKYFEFGPVASWSWIWVLLPFFFALLWFELLEPMLGLDKKKLHDQVEEVKKERVRKQFDRPPPR